MSKKSTFARILSALMIIALMIGMLPMVVLADDSTLEGRTVTEAGKSIGDSIQDFEGYTLEKLDPSTLDQDSLKRLPTQGVDLSSQSLTKISSTGLPISPEELNFVESFADELVTTVGIIDIDGENEESFNVFVWLQSLPEASERIYQRHGRRNVGYEEGRENARQARSNIRGNRNVAIDWEYSLVFSGFALEATYSELKKIAAMPGVFAITEVTYDEMDYIADPNYTTPGNAGAREIMDVGKLHAAGIDGRGVKVAVIDSGIQPDHPDLAGAFMAGYNFAARGTRNTGGRQPITPSVNSPDGNHGTHVSGTVASQGITSLGIAPGVDLYMAQVFSPDSPNAASSADTTAALEWLSGGNPSPATFPNLPVIPGGRVDVINLSMGNQVNTAYEAGHVARNNAVLAGVVVVNSAGNNAYPQNNTTDRRTYTLGSGGVSLPVSVAATQYGGNPILSYNPTVNGSAPFEVYIENGDATLSGVLRNGSFGSTEPRSVPFTPAAADIAFGPYPGSPFTVQPLVFVPGLGYELHYACAGNNPHTNGLSAGSDMTAAEMNALQAMAPGSLTGKILVVNRGQNFLDYKGQALRLGAAGLIIINRDPAVIGNLNIGSDTSAKDLMIFSAPNSVKAVMFDAVQGGTTAYLNPGDLGKLGHAPQPADFSSIGPVNETAEIKPDVTAPGWSILSTDLRNGYTEMGGTSMSSPWVAGLAALVIQQYPDAAPFEVKARIMNTSDPDLIKPLTGRLNNAAGQYFNRDGTQSSVFEQGSGFVNPLRAVYEKEFITVRIAVPTGNTDRSVREADMASFSFGHEALPEEDEESRLTDKLTATIHGGVATKVEVRYNNNTRYSNKNLDEAVVVHFENKGSTVDVWLEIFEHAGFDQTVGNLYEGIIEITVNGDVKVLPWATRLGEAPGSDFWLLYPDRPVQVVRGTAAANQDFSPYSAQNLIFFMFEGKAKADEIELRRSGNNYILDVYMIGYNAAGDPQISYRIPITIGSGAAGLKLSDFIDLGETYFVRFDGQAQAPLLGGLLWSNSTVAAGAYNLSFLFPGIYEWYQYSGIVLTNTRPVLTVEDRVITANTRTDHAFGYGTDEVTVNGRIFSAAVQRAADMDFMWAGAYAFFEGLLFPVDQSLNVLTDAGNGWELEFPNPYFGRALVPWFCDEDGYFSLTMPVQDDGYFFPEDICESGVVIPVDAFDLSFPWNAQSVFMPMPYGAMRGFQWLALTYEDAPEIEVSSAVLNNLAGTLTASFMYQNGVVPATLDIDKLSAVLTVNGEVDDILVFAGYDTVTGIATWTFAPIGGYFENVLRLEATVTYGEKWITTTQADDDVSIRITSMIPTAKVDKLNGNQNRLHIWVDVILSDGTVIQEYITVMINNNAEGTYTVGPFNVFVDTKGNDQIRAIRIVSAPGLDYQVTPPAGDDDGLDLIILPLDAGLPGKEFELEDDDAA